MPGTGSGDFEKYDESVRTLTYTHTLGDAEGDALFHGRQLHRTSCKWQWTVTYSSGSVPTAVISLTKSAELHNL